VEWPLKNVSEASLVEVSRELTVQLHRFSYLIYQLMVVGGDWTDAGREHCESAFMRCELGLGPRVAIGGGHYDEFRVVCREKVKAFGLEGLSLAELSHQVETFRVSLLGKQFTIHEFSILNRMMMDLGLPFILQGGVYGPYREFILGEGSFRVMGAYRVFVFEREVVRSPTTIMPMAAMIGEREIFIRDEAMVSVFEAKWVSFMPVAFMGDRGYYSDAQLISARVRREVFRLYGVASVAELHAVEGVFVEDLKETVLCHELGHGVIQYHLLSQEIAPVAEATKMCGECLTTALLEVLADVAPALEEVKGPLANMIEVACGDRVRAMRMFYMYLSDVWFFDTTDEYMFLYSTMISGVMASVILEGGEVDFEGLYDRLYGKNGVCTFLIELLESTVKEMMAIATHAHFEHGGERVGLEAFMAKVEQEALEGSEGGDRDATEEMIAYGKLSLGWSRVFEALMAQEEYRGALMDTLAKQEKVCLAGLQDRLGFGGEMGLKDGVFARLITLQS